MNCAWLLLIITTATMDDGLIEITDLGQLNAVRWDLDGNGLASDARHARAFPSLLPTADCGGGRCRGYELAADLDFDTDGNGSVDSDDRFWNDGIGWEPIGTSAERFESVFEGNGHTICYLFIDRESTSYVGLFGSTGRSSEIRNVTLLSVDVAGDNRVGRLVGEQFYGQIRASYTTGRVQGDNGVGGLVGLSDGGMVSASYSTATVSGQYYVGGLIGIGSGAEIIATYATGQASGALAVGGLIGEATAGSITASYATGAVIGDVWPGGLVGFLNSATVTDSFWDTETAGQDESAGGVGKPTSQLQTPTKYGFTGIFANWNVDVDNTDGDSDTATGEDAPWHFGSQIEYPYLKVFIVPDAPEGFRAEPGDGEVILRWGYRSNPPAVMSKFQFQKDGGSWTDIPSSGFGQRNSQRWTVSNLEIGTTYSFRVRAVNGVRIGPASAEVQAVPVTTPSALAILHVNGARDRISVSWAEPENNGGATITSYDVRFGLKGGVGSLETYWTVVDATWTNGPLQATIPVTGNGWDYEVQVRAVNAVGEGSWSPSARDRDSDDDGLIEIASLAQLDAIRGDLDGDGSIEDAEYVSEF